eukprot:jgi/Botrbrau1/12488/Bobra.0169s0035.1
MGIPVVISIPAGHIPLSRRFRLAAVPRKLSTCQAGARLGNGDEDPDLNEFRQKLSRSMDSPSISGRELRELVWNKWGRSYDMRLHKRGNRMYVQIMWKFLEQKSFPLTEEEYQTQLDAVAEYLTIWGVAPTVRAAIQSSSSRGPGYTGGGGARAVSIPLGVDVDGVRAAEWNTTSR